MVLEKLVKIQKRLNVTEVKKIVKRDFTACIIFMKLTKVLGVPISSTYKCRQHSEIIFLFTRMKHYTPTKARNITQYLFKGH